MLRACLHHGFPKLNQIDTFYNGLNEQDQDSLNATAGGNLLSKTTREALKIIENKSKVRYSRSKSNDSKVNTNSRDNSSKTDDRIDKLADQISNLVEIFNKQVVTPAIAKAVEKTCVICGGAHAYYDCIATDSNQPSVCATTGTYNQVSPPNRAGNQIPPPSFAPGFQNQSFQVPNNQIQSSIPNELSSYMKSNETLIRNMQNQINVLRGDFNKKEENLRRNLNNDTRSILGSFFQNQVSTLSTLLSNNVPNPKGEMKAVTTRSCLAYEGPLIPTNSPLEKVVERDTEETTDKEHSNCQGSIAHIQPPVVPISILEPDSLLTNKDKLFELEKVPLNENYSAMLLKKLPKKLGDPDKFLIPCDFLGIYVCHALADLGASINLMPLSIKKKLSLPKLTPIRMTLELADRSITRSKGVAEDVFIKVGKFHFPTDFVVVDFEADPRVPLILGRSFLRTGRALINVYEEEITLRVNDEFVTFNLNQTIRYSSTYDDNSVNRVNVIDIACEELFQDVLDFQYNSKSSNPILVSNPSFFEETESEFCKKPIVKSSSPTLTPFGESDFFLEEIRDFLNDESISTRIENSFYDPEGDILYLEKLLNEDPFQFLLMDLKQAEESPKLELKELPSHFEYAFLEESDKLPGIDLGFCTHKILMEEDYKLAVQTQRRVNPKIHDVMKKEVIKLLDVGMIYPISDSPWVSPIYCVPKKGGMIVVANENNELIPTRCMIAIFHDMIEKIMEVFMDDFLVFGDSFSSFLSNLDKTLKRCEDKNLVLNWEKCHFMCKEGVVLGHRISKSRTEVDRVKVDVIAKLPYPTTVKGVRSFLGHAGFYRCFIQDFSKIARPMTHLLEKETPFVFSKECVNAFDTLKKKLTESSILVVPDWNLPFELMYDASDFVIGATAGDHRKLQPNELNELYDQAYKNSLIYKERTKKFHDSKIKKCIFNVGDQVLLFNSRLKIFSRKLKTSWSGPFTITQVFSYGNVELSQPNGSNFKVNGPHVKHYFRGDIPSNVVPDLHMFLMEK
nr:DNA-directed DNA polymerase [Tanacetum cinerariifolium]